MRAYNIVRCNLWILLTLTNKHELFLKCVFVSFQGVILFQILSSKTFSEIVYVQSLVEVHICILLEPLCRSRLHINLY